MSARRMVRTDPGASTDINRAWTIPARLESIQPIVDMVQQLCREAGCSDRHCGLHIPVALSEAMANAVAGSVPRDDSAQVDVTLVVSADRVTMTVRDQGAGFDLQAVQHSPADDDWLEREDGRGVFLMRALMHEVESTLGPDGHTLRLILRRT